MGCVGAASVACEPDPEWPFSESIAAAAATPPTTAITATVLSFALTHRIVSHASRGRGGGAHSDRPGYEFTAAPVGFACRSQPWNGPRSPASQAARSPGALRSQSGRISLVAARRSRQRSTTDGRPQNQ